MIQSYKDIVAYQRSYQASLLVYKEVRTFPKEEMFGLTNQIKRASYSIPLNIAEGYGKRSSMAEFKRYLQMAIGSCDEVRVLLDFCKDLEFIKEPVYIAIYAEYEEIGKMLNSLHNNWK